MNLNKTFGVFLVLGLFVCFLQADGPERAPATAAEMQDAGKDKPKQMDKDKDKDKKKPDSKDPKTPDKKLTEPAQTNVFDQALLPRGETATAFNPHMLGDFAGGYARQTVTLFGTLTTTQTVTTVFGGESEQRPVTHTTTTTTPFNRTATILVPIPFAGAFKVAENASPMPVDRVFTTYNYYDNIQGPGGAPIPGANSQSTTITGAPGLFGAFSTTTTTSAATVAGLPRVTADLNREVFGFEKTFLDGYASIEMRMPLLQQTSPVNGFGANDTGDLTIIAKYAFFLDRATGNVLSGGLAVTAPTGPRIPTIDGNLHSTYLQPWFGYIWNADRFFLHAFHSVVVPTDSRDVTLLFNDVGLNYWLYRNDSNRFLNFIVPLAEVHVTTPLDHRDMNGAFYVPDIVELTGGVHFGLFRNTTLSFGVATPVTGPRVYNIEGFMQLNWRF